VAEAILSGSPLFLSQPFMPQQAVTMRVVIEKNIE